MFAYHPVGVYPLISSWFRCLIFLLIGVIYWHFLDTILGHTPFHFELFALQVIDGFSASCPDPFSFRRLSYIMSGSPIVKDRVYVENKSTMKMILNCWDLSDWVRFLKKKTKQDKDITNCISVVYTETKIELLGPIWLGAVCDKNQTTQRRDWLYMCRLWWKWNWTIKLIKLGVIYYENQKGQWHERSYMYGLHRKRHRVVMIDQTGCSLWWKPDKIRTWLIIQVWSCWKQNWILGTYLTRCNLWRKPNNTITWPIV